MRSLTLIPASILTVCFIASASAQIHFSARSDLVVLNVAVTNDKGGFIGGLPADVFHVRDEGRPQEVSFFAEQDAPATIGMLIDASGSMLENRNRVIAGITEFAKASHPDDEFLPLVFNEHVTSVLPEAQRFTSDPEELRHALTGNLNSRGRTAFHDALAHAVDALGQGNHDRKVLIVLSDGGDNQSRLKFGEAFERVLASNVVIYSIALIDPLAFDHNPKALRRLADGTGGLAFQPERVADIGRVFQSISRDIRSRYTLAFEPAQGSAGGQMRRVRVTVDAPGHSNLKVRTRTAYVTAPPAQVTNKGEEAR